MYDVRQTLDSHVTWMTPNGNVVTRETLPPSLVWEVYQFSSDNQKVKECLYRQTLINEAITGYSGGDPELQKGRHARLSITVAPKASAARGAGSEGRGVPVGRARTRPLGTQGSTRCQRRPRCGHCEGSLRHGVRKGTRALGGNSDHSVPMLLPGRADGLY